MQHGDQPDLFPGVEWYWREHGWKAAAHARREDKATSHAAAESVKASAKSIMDEIHRDLRQRGPGTFSELATRINRPDGQVWKRLSDLERAGRVTASGQTRKGPSGRQQTVWEAV